MAINRTRILQELEPGLDAVFGEEYGRYENEHEAIFQTVGSNRAFEEDVLFTGFGAAAVKPEGTAVTYDDATEQWVARYNHETIALAFAITEEAMEDNLYESLGNRLSKALARSMSHTKQVKAANVLNNGFDSGYVGGDGLELFSTAHVLRDGGTESNEPSTAVDMSETALEDALISIANWVDDRGIPISVQAQRLVIPVNLVFVAERLLGSTLRPDSANNDVNAINKMNMFPGGAVVNHRLTDTDAWFIMTDCPDGLKHFVRAPLTTGMEGDFETGNVRYKARERYSFGWSDWRGAYGSPGA